MRLKWTSIWKSLVMPNRKGCVPPLRHTESVCFFLVVITIKHFFKLLKDGAS